jgi:hypothetical protein
MPWFAWVCGIMPWRAWFAEFPFPVFGWLRFICDVFQFEAGDCGVSHAVVEVVGALKWTGLPAWSNFLRGGCPTGVLLVVFG